MWRFDVNCHSLARAAAASLLVGFYLSSRGLSNRTIGMIMGFGAGAYLSAIAYELIPEFLLGKSSMLLALFFTLGAFTFFGIDWWIDHLGGADRKDAGNIRTRRQPGWHFDGDGIFGRCTPGAHGDLMIHTTKVETFFNVLLFIKNYE